MRAAPSLVLVAAATLFTISAATPAGADVGPTPRCGAGTHHEYLYGHHCVADGSHLAQDPNGGYKTVSDSAKDTNTAAVPPSPNGTPTAAPTATPTSAPAPTVAPAAPDGPLTPPPGPPATEQPVRRGCGCDIAGTGGRGDWLIAAAGIVVALVRRRRAG